MEHLLKSVEEILALADSYEQELPPAPPALPIPLAEELASWIDHTLLKPEATAEDIKRLCAEARQYRFATVCVNPVYVSLARSLLEGSGVGVCAVVAFPLGATLPEDKAYETQRVIRNGAMEVDMVMNIGALKGQAYGLVLNDILFVAQEAHEHGAKLKVILETALLSRREKILACLFARAAGADFVKTSTGFGPGGATVEDVALMRRVVGETMGVKASGGIRSWKDARAMIAAGANRLGASAGVTILREAMSNE
ncbi:MAG: deoxyribose-phosphate aldolase [Anaerolineales bacterium]|nr:deoxyribose-phosphate aldolase [Anaerolineales bacterium]MCX7608224.1 deoxyribose-phosphate aldolase [Anaerolineales bacterium]MDW8227045.1 deoxyribose-phosphate aldolase [Anaerolineales bacterium]